MAPLLTHKLGLYRQEVARHVRVKIHDGVAGRPACVRPSGAYAMPAYDRQAIERTRTYAQVFVSRWHKN